MADAIQTQASKRVVELRRAFRREFWHGRKQLTGAERAAVKRVAYLEALAEQARARCLAGDGVSYEDMVRAENTARRARRDLAAMVKPRSDIGAPASEPTTADLVARMVARQGSTP